MTTQRGANSASPLSGILTEPTSKPSSDFKPLCFSIEAFSEEGFSVDKFISDFRRRNLPLDSVLVDLRKYGTSLESQLLELINQDYADFVNLSSNLQGIDKVIQNLRVPIQTLRSEVATLQTAIHDEILEIEDKLEKREQIQQKKHFLTLFLDIYQIITKIEALLRVGEANPVQFTESDEDTSNLIQRVANDFNQLKYYVSKTKNFPFVKNLGERINRIETTMQEGLETLFCDGLQNSDRDVVANCLRTYAAIDRISDVESLFLTKKVNPFLQTVINMKVYEENGLDFIYNQVISWITKDCSLLLELTHKSVRGFDFLTNSIFTGVVEELSSNVPASFGAGFPEVFHKNFLISQKFLDDIEQFFVTVTELQAFRKSEIYTDFQKRWNVSIYFGLRYQVIARTMEKSLGQNVTLQDASSHTPNFYLPQSSTLWEQLQQCWAPKNFLPALTDSFFKLSLQLISRYSSWIEHGIHNLQKSKEVEANVFEAVVWTQNVPQEQFIFIYQDMEILAEIMPTSYIQSIKSLQPSLSPRVFEILQNGYGNLRTLRHAMKLLGEIICGEITKQCLTSLSSVRGIMQMYRSTNRAPSDRPSFYVQTIFSSLAKFLSTDSLKNISESSKKSWILQVATDVTKQYTEWSAEMLETAKKQNTILKKFIKTQQESDSGSTLKVEEKIAIQLSLDVMAYEGELKKLGIDVQTFEPLAELSSCFRDNLPEGMA